MSVQSRLRESHAAIVVIAFLGAALAERALSGPSDQVTMPLTIGVAVWGVCWWSSIPRFSRVPLFLVLYALVVGGGWSAAATATAVLFAELGAMCRLRRRLGHGAFEGGVGALALIFAGSAAAAAAGALTAAIIAIPQGLSAAGGAAWAVFVPHLLSIIIIVPLAEAWRSPLRVPKLEFALSLVLVSVGLLAMYEQMLISALVGELSQYLLLGALGWSAVRLGPKGITAAMFLCAVGSPYWTALGFGPFSDLAASLARSLVAVQIATVVVAVVLEGGTILINDLRATTQELRMSAAVLEEQQVELRRANAELAQFAYLSSHELQEPLRMLAAYLSLLADRYHGRLDEGADEYIEIAVQSAGRLRTLVDDLLGYSQTGGVAPQRTPVSLAAVVSDLLVWRNDQILEAEATITVGELPEAYGDALLLRLVLDNLLSNALRFRRPGVAPTISIEGRRVGDSIEVRVQDDGIGIPEGQRERVFEPFRRVHPRHRYPGTGLGLTIVASLVRKHGGTVWIEDAPSGGTIVGFSVSAVPSTAASRRLASHRQSEQSQSGGIEVLGGVNPSPVPPTMP